MSLCPVLHEADFFRFVKSDRHMSFTTSSFIKTCFPKVSRNCVCVCVYVCAHTHVYVSVFFSLTNQL